MNTAVSRSAVGEYVAAVRAELDDLSPDEIEELTGGLEADLADALATEGEADPARRFGTPAAYAAELRSAAGLAPRAVSGGGRRGVRTTVEGWHATLRRQSWYDPAVTYLVSLRPAWWLVRAVAVAVGAALFLGWSGLGLLLLIVLIPVSLAAGRKAWQHRGPLPRLGVAALNGLAALVLLVGLLAAMFSGSGSSGETAYYDDGQTYGNGTGLTTQEGYTVANIFPYDKDGKPLDDVQLFDDRGRPLNADQSYVDAQGRKIEYAPGVDSNGQQRWNAYPLRERDPFSEGEIDPVTGEPAVAPTGPPHAATRPDPSVAPLVALPTTAADESAAPTPASPAPTAPAPSGDAKDD